MSNNEEDEVATWCMDCEALSGDNCLKRKHAIVTTDTAHLIVPDLSGTPVPQHTDIHHF